MSQRKLPNFGLMLQEKALQFFKGLGNVEFKTSNDWFDSFRKRNNIAFYIKSGEKADVDVAVVEDCKEKLATHLEGYNTCFIFNINEKGTFSVQLRPKLWIKKIKNVMAVRKQKCDWRYLSVQI